MKGAASESALSDVWQALSEKLEEAARRYHEREPDVHAFVAEPGRWARLERAAREVTGRFPSPDSAPLIGTLLGVKDIFHVAGLPTGGGSRLPAKELAGPQAAVVTALRDAGAIVLGKTVTTEFAYFAPGPTRNPHHLGHTPGGSSSGSAAAVAAGFCPLALGTQTIGSINRPAAYCGVVGYKPSYERISREGVIPLSPSLDHVGFLGADVPMVRRAAAVTAAAWQPEPGLERPTLGVPTGPYLNRASRAGQWHFAAVCRRLRDAGYTIVEVPLLADFDDIVERHQALMAAEAAAVHERWLLQYGDLYHSRTVELIRRGQEVEPSVRERARDGRFTLRETLQEEMRRAGVDCWLAPPATGAAPAGQASTGDPIMNLPWTYAGLPTVTLPAGSDRAGLPMGVQLIAGWYRDEQLLDWSDDMAAVVAKVEWSPQS